MAKARQGFTLVELLITMMIIAIMSGMVLFAMWQSQETAKAHRTRALITKLNTIIMRRYDEYQTRRVPIHFTQSEISAGPQAMAKIRVDCLRDLMRMEMPDRWSDVTDDPVTPFLRANPDKIARPVLYEAYRSKYNAANSINTSWPTTEHQGAECLYMIVMEAIAQDGDSRDFFKSTDVDDLDGDQCPEFIDAWRRPIQFIRWAPGFQSPLQTPIRLTVDIAPNGTNSTIVTVTANDGPRLSQTPGSYVGASMVIVDDESQIIDTRKMAPITGYNYTLTPVLSVKFTCETPSSVAQQPFGGATGRYTVLVTQPDPFDPRHVYPIYSPPTPDLSSPTFAIYPLIYSKGADGVGGLVDDVGTIRYADPATVALNPFFIPPSMTEPFGLMLGSALNRNGTEPGWYKGSHLDNITSHDGLSR